MSTVQVGVDARAGLELEHVSLGAKCPDACERRIQMLHDGLGAALQKLLEAALPGQGDTDIRCQRGQACTFFDQSLGPLPLSDVLRLRRQTGTAYRYRYESGTR